MQENDDEWTRKLLQAQVEGLESEVKELRELHKRHDREKIEMMETMESLREEIEIMESSNEEIEKQLKEERHKMLMMKTLLEGWVRMQKNEVEQVMKNMKIAEKEQGSC